MRSADRRILTFFAAWQALRGGRLVPYRRDFDPMAVASLLSSIWLYRYDSELEDFVCRLAGEDVNQAWGGSIRGLTLRQIVGQEDHRVVLSRWRNIIAKPAIHYGAAMERLTNQELRRAERLIVPLSDDNGDVNFVIGISLYRLGPVDPERRPLQPEDVVQIPCSEL